ncbi:MAG: DNA polymerase III subunit delta' [Planctomycetota bacterium]
MPFSEVQHQTRALSILRQALASGRMHHAYLFEGPDGIGKELAARALATRLLCQDAELTPEADACGKCRSCQLLAADNHPDFHLIHRGLHKRHPDRAIRASKGLFLVVDLVRTFLIEPATTKPALGGWRVFLVRDAELMNEGAQNALLKTLEEPPGQACLILVTSSAERLLPTIRSRCQRIPFDLLPPAFVREQLATQLDIDSTSADTLAGLADGRLGAALRWHRVGLLEALGQVTAALDRLDAVAVESFGNALVDAATSLAQRSMRAGQEEAEEWSAEENNAKSNSKTVPTDELRAALKLVLMLVAAIYRDILVATVDSTARRCLPALRQRNDKQAQEASFEMLDARVRAVVNAEYMLDRNVAPQLVCERLGLALTGTVPVR